MALHRRPFFICWQEAQCNTTSGNMMTLANLWTDTAVAAAWDGSLHRCWGGRWSRPWQWTVGQWWLSTTGRWTVIYCHTIQGHVNYWYSLLNYLSVSYNYLLTKLCVWNFLKLWLLPLFVWFLAIYLAYLACICHISSKSIKCLWILYKDCKSIYL